MIAYDVQTETAAGRRRLRKVAQICKNYGQRVQFSVFECSVSRAQLEQLQHELVKIIDIESDSLRIYVLHLGRNASRIVYGRDRYVDFEQPLVL